MSRLTRWELDPALPLAFFEAMVESSIKLGQAVVLVGMRPGKNKGGNERVGRAKVAGQEMTPGSAPSSTDQLQVHYNG